MPRINERYVYLVNPLPDVPESDLLKRAGLDLIEPIGASPFRYIGRVGGYGEEAPEAFVLDPGQRKLLRESEARPFLYEAQEFGIVTYDAEASPDDAAAAELTGLRTALQFYRDRGAVRLKEIRKVLGVTAEEMHDSRHDHYPYHLNEAKAAVIAEEIRRRTAAPKTKK